MQKYTVHMATVPLAGAAATASVPDYFPTRTALPGVTTTVVNPHRAVDVGGLDARHERITRLQRKVEAAKAARLSCLEWCVKGLGVIFTLPSMGLSGFVSVPTNHKAAIFRFGKLDRVLEKPGLHWLPLFYERVQCFAGTQTHRMDQLNVVDAAGNPIIVRALLEYNVEDPAALQIATGGSTSVLFNQAEQVVREACTKLPLLGEKGADIRSQIHDLGAAMVADLQHDANVFGIQVQRLTIVEARYAPEIASQMLMKQQAAAMVAARKEIMAGALGIVNDTLAEFPGVSVATKEKIICNLLVTLTSHQQAAPVVPLQTA